VDISMDGDVLPGMYRNETGDGLDSLAGLAGDLDALTAASAEGAAGVDVTGDVDFAKKQDFPPENGSPLDQNGEDGYTKEGNRNSPATSAESSSVMAPDDAEVTDMFPDLDSMAEGFFSPVADVKAESVKILPEAGFSGGSKKADIGGDYDPKDVASAIQTILKRDE
jgi:hypothetical protein